MCVTPYLNWNLNRLTLCMKVQQGQCSRTSFQFMGKMVRQSLQFPCKVLGSRADSYGYFIHKTAITSSFALPLRTSQELTNHTGKPDIPDSSALYDSLLTAQFRTPPDPTQSSYANKFNCISRYCPWTHTVPERSDIHQAKLYGCGTWLFVGELFLTLSQFLSVFVDYISHTPSHPPSGV